MVTFSTITPAQSNSGGGDEHHSSPITTYTYLDSAVTDSAGNHLYIAGSSTTAPTNYSFATIADPYVIEHTIGTEAGPALVGAGGLGILAWAFFI